MTGDVENAVIHALRFGDVGYCRVRCGAFIHRMNVLYFLHAAA